MNFSHIIAELLEEHDYVIVPGLGAFRASHLSARFDEEGIKMLPPSRTLSFNPDVKMNDGVVTGYLVHRLKIPASRAQKLTGEFSDDVVYRLGQGEAIVLEGLGTLKMEGSHMEFSPAGTLNETGSSFGLEPVRVIPPEAIAPEAVNIRPDSAMSQPELPIPASPIPEAGVNQPEAMIGHPEVANREEGDHPSGAIRPEGADAGVKGSPEKHKKKLRPVIWLALILLPVLVAAAWFLIFHKEQDPDRLNPSTTAIVPTTAPAPSAADSLTQGTDPSAGDSTLAPQEAAPREPLYFLVGGSFQSRQNADTYITKMSGKGYHPVHLGQYGTYFIVAIDSFKTEREAVRAVNQFNVRHPNTGAWIFHRKTK